MNVQEWADAAETLVRAGGWAIVVIFIFAIITGRIVPRFVVRDVRVDRDERLKYVHERVTEQKDVASTWRAAHAASEAARTEQDTLLREAIQGIERLTQLVTPVVPPTMNGSGPRVQEVD